MGSSICSYRLSHQTNHFHYFYHHLVWIYCPGHAGVRGNERADRLASRAPLTGTLVLDRSDILRSLCERMLSDDTVIDEGDVLRLRECGVCLGKSRTGRLRGRSRRVCNQRATGTISLHNLRFLLRETEHLWVCPECSDVYSVTN